MSGTEDLNLRKYLQSEAYDLFETEIYPRAYDIDFPNVKDIETFLVEYRKGLWEMYWKIMEAANTFIAPLCLRDLACALYDRASCIKKQLVEINREIARYENAERGGAAYHDIMIYETGFENVHDKAEAVEEKKTGYKY